ncbi:MAG: DUF2007 domain-containing protein [Dokdonella sp.]
MRRIYWAVEVQDAHIVESLLHARGIGAWSFDSGILRLNWLKVLAYGGCRVMVANSDVEQALQIVRAYRAGELALPDEDADSPRCPACDRCVSLENPAPRRGVFAFLIACYWALPMLAIASASAAFRWIAWSGGLLALTLFLPGVVGRLVKSRFRCSDCGHTWRAPPRHSFGEMARTVEAAERNYDAAQPMDKTAL